MNHETASPAGTGSGSANNTAGHGGTAGGYVSQWVINKDTLQVIDKSTLQRVAELRPEKGKTLAHVEFTRDGRYALASLMERRADGGALIVFDAETFKEVKRIPMDKPVGKYNLYNKINRSEGTSH